MAKAVPRPADRKAWDDLYAGVGRSPREARTISGVPLQALYDPADLPAGHFEDKQGYPGLPPYTRGVYPSMYRDKLWTMRQFAGFGSAKQTHERYLYLLGQAPDRLPSPFALPTPISHPSYTDTPA